MMATKEINTILSSLTLEKPKKSIKEIQSISCLKCIETFEFPTKNDEYLAHLFLAHRLVIADVEDIGDLKDYLLYWVEKFNDHELEEYCTTMLLDQLPDGTPSKNEKYYLLSDILPQDYELRKRLHTQRLENILTQHQFELTDRNFSRECLHCRDIIKGLRSDYLEHLYNKHFIQLGKPEKLVFIDELIDVLQNKLDNLICLFCEKIFKDRSTLKEHMRKKGHKRINPDLKFYDKYYIINYKNEKPKHVKNFKFNHKEEKLCTNDTSILKHSNDRSRSMKNTENNNSITINNDNVIIDRNKLNDKNHSFSDDEDSDWSDWDGEKQLLTCLYCSKKENEFSTIKHHMLTEHLVNFDDITKKLNFYQKIKVVNYVRRQMHILKCVKCNQRYENTDELQLHMKENQHCGIGDKKQWDQPEFFFPTYEDDGILYLLDNENDNDFEDPQISVQIYSEDSKADINKDAEKLSIENFVF